jgi:hypothetical protein
VSDIEKLGLPRILEVLHTCDWSSSALDDTENVDSVGATDIDFELNFFDDDKQQGSEKDVENMEQMMVMLLHAKGLVPLFID